ncbi:hypothetical protein LOZ53_005778 [Ophidiomyces ophidiicola]|nr:hypothetical protein LOZ54_005708 [Ophidiomyces ophidiicola]KAI1981565.1 hypothetical protein LOZ55_000587 [Ophidiomyces ophidiicola]KAI1983652.1 hypothetical protein LOZ53_005778 [Ophidiomyces ophidiicola]
MEKYIIRLPPPCRSEIIEDTDTSAQTEALGESNKDFFDEDKPTWTPKGHREVFIQDLAVGPRRVTFIARVVNIYDLKNRFASNDSTGEKRPATGCLKLLVRDWSGIIQVLLWYLDVEYEINLGTLLTIWITHVSHANPQPKTGAKLLKTSIFPEKDQACHVHVIENDLGTVACVPIGYDSSAREKLKGIVKLRNITEAVEGEARMLVWVKAVRAVTRPQKKGEIVEERNVGIADDTGEAVLYLSGRILHSAQNWMPNVTVLLLSNVTWKSNGTRAYISAYSQVEINPDMEEAEWLRRHAKRVSAYINEDVPQNGKEKCV